MMPERKVRRVLCIVFLVSMLLVPPMMTRAVAEKTWKVQHRGFFPWCWMWGVRDSEMHVNQSDEKLRVFFAGCQTPVDFYDRIQEHVLDSNREVQYTDLCMREQRLPVIVDMAMSNGTVYLFCHHQALLFAAGVKAVFSEYDD